MDDIKNTVDFANKLTKEDLNWKPLYPNNMKCNGLDGYYCLIIHQDEESNNISARKYTIRFQYEEIEKGTGLIDTNKINCYLLFEKNYMKIEGPFEHPTPTEDESPSWHDKNTLNSYELNDYGRLVYAYDNIEDAKKRAVTQYKAVYGYALSHLTEKES